MPESAVLFVKSRKVEQLEYTVPNFGHYCSAGYRAIDTNRVLSEDDRTVAEGLGKCGLEFAVVDLGSAGFAARLKAKMKGVGTTPTLFYRGQKLEGVKQIVGSLPKLVSEKV